MKKLVKAADRVLDRLLSILFLLCFMAGLYGLYDSWKIYRKASDHSLLRYKPGYESDGEPDRPIIGNMVAWLTVDGTSIDYPVMQGKDNFEYLDRDPYGDYSLAGSIFLDARNAPDFSDEYMLIYGHHMEGGMMFGALDDYLDEDFFLSHNSAELTVGSETFRLRAYAVLETQSSERAVFEPTETDVQETLRFVKDNALHYDKGSEPSGNERILALSTCKYPDTAERTVVVFSV